MNEEQIKSLLNDKETTVNQVINILQASVDQFQEKAIDRHAKQLKKELKKNNVDEFDVDRESQLLFATIQAEAMEFIENQHNKTVDMILDLVNERQVNKQAAYNFISIMTTVKAVFSEQISS